MRFGIRVVGDKKVVFLYRITNYANSPKRELIHNHHILHLSDDVTSVFGFLNMSYKSYSKKEFKTIFDFTEWFTSNCQYITLDVVKSLENEINALPEQEVEDIHKAVRKFIDTIRLGHIVLRDFKYLPIMLYGDLKESIVRTYYDSSEVEKQFVNLKLQYFKDTELPGKFSPKKVVTWIDTLKSNPKLTSVFTRSFVDYITQNNMKEFPRFLIDTDPVTIKKEVLSYYYNMFPNSAAYREYVLEIEEANEVDK